MILINLKPKARRADWRYSKITKSCPGPGPVNSVSSRHNLWRQIRRFHVLQASRSILTPSWTPPSSYFALGDILLRRTSTRRYIMDRSRATRGAAVVHTDQHPILIGRSEHTHCVGAEFGGLACSNRSMGSRRCCGNDAVGAAGPSEMWMACKLCSRWYHAASFYILLPVEFRESWWLTGCM